MKNTIGLKDNSIRDQKSMPILLTEILECCVHGDQSTYILLNHEQVGGITFFLSSVLDNLTSTIVMVSLLRKLVTDPEQRRYDTIHCFFPSFC